MGGDVRIHAIARGSRGTAVAVPRAVTIPPIPTPHERGDLHAELDRLDRELETMRARLAREQGELHDASARCRALTERASAPPPDDVEDSDPDAPAAHHASRRLARTSRLGSASSGSRPLRAASARGPSLRAIAGGAPTERAAPARPPTPSRDFRDDPPDAA